jgi:hypothetical protein
MFPVKKHIDSPMVLSPHPDVSRVNITGESR